MHIYDYLVGIVGGAIVRNTREEKSRLTNGLPTRFPQAHLRVKEQLHYAKQKLA